MRLALSLLSVGTVVVSVGCGTSGTGPAETLGNQVGVGSDAGIPASGRGGVGGFGGGSGGGAGAPLPASTGAGPTLLTGDAGPDGYAPKTTTGDPTTCAEAAQAHTYVGCDYWPTVVANQVWSIFDFAVVVANAGTTAATVTVAGVAGNTTVMPGQLAKIYLPWVPALKGPDADNCGGVTTPLTASLVAPGGAYHLTSTAPVTVYQFSALEYHGQGGPAGKSWKACPGNMVCADPNSPNFAIGVGCYSFSNDASLLLPSTAMTGNYRVIGHESWVDADNTVQPPFTLPNDAYVAITATQNATKVTIKVSSTGQIAAGNMGVVATGPGGTLTLTLNSGDVAELVGAGGSDLSGSIIQASAPVQVITGMPCATIPPLDPACDHMEESVFPAETLGKDYIVTRPPGPNGDVVPHQVRIFGNVDGTNLTYNPAAPPGCPATINAGQVVECGNPQCPAMVDITQNLGATCGTTNADFEITGDQPFAVGTFTLAASLVDPNPPVNVLAAGDPAQSIVPANEQFRVKYVFLAPDDYTVSYVDIVAKPGTAIMIDGQAPTAAPQTIGTSGYSVYRQKLGPGQAGAHVLTSSLPVGIQVVGYGAFTSYMYPGGLNLNLIAPPPALQ